MTTKVANVLVVEDDSSTLNCERLILEGGGYSVSWAASGEQAIEMVADNSPDLIIMDIGLPGIDGFTTCKVIRKFSQVPIIMVSGSDSEADKIKGLGIGADDYITKPFSDEELFARSNAVLRHSTPGDVAFERVDNQGWKLLNLVRSPKYARVARSITGAVAQLYSASFRHRRGSSSGPLASCAGARVGVNGLSTQPGKSPRWASFYQRTRHAVHQAWRAAYLIAGALALLTREIAICVWGSAAAQRVRATRPAMKLGEMSARLLGSGFVAKARVGLSRTWKAWSDYLAAFLSSFGRGQKRPAESVPVPTDGQEAMVLEEDQATAVPLEGPRDVGATALRTRYMAFLEELLRAYLKVAETTCSDPMVSAPVVPLVNVYEQMLSSSRLDGAFSQQEFAQEIYHLHRSGLNTTLTGARVQFPISRGVEGKTLRATDESGRKVRYYGIRFLQTGDSDTKHLPEAQSFDTEEVAQYQPRIREALRRQMEWPSAEFARFMAAQISLEGLDAKQSRLFAQITRDSLQGFLNDYGAPDGPETSQEPVRRHDASPPDERVSTLSQP